MSSDDVDISYDRNSNIMWVEDNVHAGFDVKYTMDDLDRLIDAEEGTRSGSNITSRTRHQTWLQSGTSQLSHTGNWARSKLDIDGDDNWNESDEYDDTRTHNKVNELTARDTDTNGTNNYTLSYDAAGNLTDDAESYEYEYDAFYRLRKVKNQSSTLLAEYRYNGLGHMIGVHEDTDADGDADASDLWFYSAYDERWREVARYRESDSSPKEQFVNATAGLDGYGRSSYTNDVVCRNRDANSGWTAASDGTLEERYFYCPNWRGDVSALVSSGRHLHEMDKYSPYGIPFGLPGGDTNSDGDNDSADATQIQTWIDTSTYDVRGNVDLDGDVDSTDKTLAQVAPISGNALGWSNLSDEAFRVERGLAGYEENGEHHTHVRYRSYSAHLGRWLQHDPKTYEDGMDLYEYAMSAPIILTDPFGTTTSESSPCPPCPPGYNGWWHCGGHRIFCGVVQSPICEFCETYPERCSCDVLCSCNPTVWGITYCTQPPKPCVCRRNMPRPFRADADIAECVSAHEAGHVAECNSGLPQDEPARYAEEADCLGDKINGPPDPPNAGILCTRLRDVCNKGGAAGGSSACLDVDNICP